VGVVGGRLRLQIAVQLHEALSEVLDLLVDFGVEVVEPRLDRRHLFGVRDVDPLRVRERDDGAFEEFLAVDVGLTGGGLDRGFRGLRNLGVGSLGGRRGAVARVGRIEVTHRGSLVIYAPF